MDAFKVFTLGPQFALRNMQSLVKHLHKHQQHYILMVDPGRRYSWSMVFHATNSIL